MRATACPEVLADAGEGALRAGEFVFSPSAASAATFSRRSRMWRPTPSIANTNTYKLNLDGGRQVFLAQQCAHVVRDLTGARYVWTKDAPAGTAAVVRRRRAAARGWRAPAQRVGAHLGDARRPRARLRAAVHRRGRVHPRRGPRHLVGGGGGRRHSGAAPAARAAGAAAVAVAAARTAAAGRARRPRRLARVDAGTGRGALPHRVRQRLCADVRRARRRVRRGAHPHPAQRRPRRHLPRRRRARCARRRLAAVPLRVHAAAAEPRRRRGSSPTPSTRARACLGSASPDARRPTATAFRFWRPRPPSSPRRASDRGTHVRCATARCAPACATLAAEYALLGGAMAVWAKDDRYGVDSADLGTCALFRSARTETQRTLWNAFSMHATRTTGLPHAADARGGADHDGAARGPRLRRRPGALRLVEQFDDETYTCSPASSHDAVELDADFLSPARILYAVEATGVGYPPPSPPTALPPSPPPPPPPPPMPSCRVDNLPRADVFRPQEYGIRCDPGGAIEGDDDDGDRDDDDDGFDGDPIFDFSDSPRGRIARRRKQRLWEQALPERPLLRVLPLVGLSKPADAPAACQPRSSTPALEGREYDIDWPPKASHGGRYEDEAECGVDVLRPRHPDAPRARRRVSDVQPGRQAGRALRASVADGRGVLPSANTPRRTSAASSTTASRSTGTPTATWRATGCREACAHRCAAATTWRACPRTPSAKTASTTGSRPRTPTWR